MSDLIHKGKLFNALANAHDKGEIFAIIQNAPTVDAVVRDKGEWVDCSPYMGHYCSRCGRITGNAILYDGTLISKFCDNCGADMRGEHGN